jgi:hydrogenase maturation protease
MDPMTVLVTLEQLGGSVERVVIVGCEPLDVGERMGLSEHVTAAVNVAVEMVEEVVAREMAARHVEVN